MGSAFMMGIDLVKLAVRHEWTLKAHPGGDHPYILTRLNAPRPVPIRHKLKNRLEVQIILKQLEIPRADWPNAAK
jgi:(p)ppGpp synthase/HD superfamily hydrolase